MLCHGKKESRITRLKMTLVGCMAETLMDQYLKVGNPLDVDSVKRSVGNM